MLKKIKDLFKKVSFIRRSKAEELASKAAEQATNEEKQWHVRGGEPSRALVNSEPQDYSYLYEQHDPNEPITEKQIHEAFIGTYAKDYNSSTWWTNTQTQDQLWMMQDAVVEKYHVDPHCRSIIENWVHYTVGGGVRVDCENPKVMKVLNKFRSDNRMVQREKEFIRMLYLQGELFIAYYVNELTGEVKIRRIKPDEIIDIETHPGDIETAFAYHQQYDYSLEGTNQQYKADHWLADCDYSYQFESTVQGLKKARSKHKLKKAPVVQFIKFGLDGEIRGRVPLQPVIKHLKYYEDWLMDRIRLNHERAKVVWIKEIRGRLPETTQRQRRAPKGGVMLLETEDVKYRIEKPQINADDAKEDGLAILYTIGAGTNLPIHILNQRSGEEVYASIRKADTPFSQYIRGKQEYLSESFEKMYRKVIHAAVEAGTLPKRVRVPDYTQESMLEVLGNINEMVLEGVDPKVIRNKAEAMLKPTMTMKPVNTEEVPFALDFPEVIREDITAQAQVFKIHKEIGIASAATLAAKAGYNWRQELSNMLNEKELFPEETSDKPSKFGGKSSTGTKPDSATQPAKKEPKPKQDRDTTKGDPEVIKDKY